MSPVRRLRPEERAAAPPHTASLIPRLDPAGSSSPSIASARNAVRHRIRDGLPSLDTNPVPFNTVRLEELTDQIGVPPPATPTQTVFQLRFDDVPTGRWIPVTPVPGTLVAFLDGAWTSTTPTVDANSNGNFTLPVPPVSRILVSYAWQYFSDGALDSFLDQGRQWLREFPDLALVPDGLVPALVSYASALALRALARSATIADVRAGDETVSWSKLAALYVSQAEGDEKLAATQREQFYSQGPEALDPSVVVVTNLRIPPYTPER